MLCSADERLQTKQVQRHKMGGNSSLPVQAWHLNLEDLISQKHLANRQNIAINTFEARKRNSKWFQQFVLMQCLWLHTVTNIYI